MACENGAFFFFHRDRSEFQSADEEDGANEVAALASHNHEATGTECPDLYSSGVTRAIQANRPKPDSGGLSNYEFV